MVKLIYGFSKKIYIYLKINSLKIKKKIIKFKRELRGKFMTMRNRLIISSLILAIFSWFGWSTYGYLFSSTNPTIEIKGIEPDNWYCNDVICVVKAQDNYKVGNISVKLDGKPLAENSKSNKQKFELPITISTDSLQNGKHELDIEVENGTYSKAKSSKKIDFNIDNVPLHAAFLKNGNDAKVSQGRTLRVQFQVNKEINNAKASALGGTFCCNQESPRSLIYECFIPVDCEEPAKPDNQLIIEITDKVGNKAILQTNFKILPFQFKKQSIKIDSDKIKNENESGLNEKVLEQELEDLTAKSPKTKLWQGTFCTPIDIKDKNQITTEFGVIRTTQERGLRQHKALDVYTTPKSVVWATQDGNIIIKNRYAHSGNTVVIDHGCGIFTLYFHLDSFADIDVGDKIKKGNPVGKLGKTGYATGYHLHWEMRINNIPVDPLQWTNNDF